VRAERLRKRRDNSFPHMGGRESEENGFPPPGMEKIIEGAKFVSVPSRRLGKAAKVAKAGHLI